MIISTAPLDGRASAMPSALVRRGFSAQKDSEGAAAPRRSASAGHPPDFDRVTVTHCQFFAGGDSPEAEQVKPTVDAQPAQVGLAGVIDELSAASARAAVHTPIGIHCRDVGIIGGAYLHGILVPEVFTGVFDYPAVSRNFLQRKNPITMQRGIGHPEAEAGRLRIDLARFGKNCFHLIRG